MEFVHKMVVSVSKIGQGKAVKHMKKRIVKVHWYKILSSQIVNAINQLLEAMNVQLYFVIMIAQVMGIVRIMDNAYAIKGTKDQIVVFYR